MNTGTKDFLIAELRQFASEAVTVIDRRTAASGQTDSVDRDAELIRLGSDLMYLNAQIADVSTKLKELLSQP